MKIITISRQFGSGGRELGKRLADLLGWDYYDKEIITTLAENKGLEKDYVNHVLNNHEWNTIPITYRSSLSQPVHNSGVRISLLLEQRRIIEDIAKTGNDCIIVGRDADIILSDYKPLRIFVCADMQDRIARCVKHEEKKPEELRLTEKDLRRSIKRIDKGRSQTREILTGKAWADCTSFDLTLNTSVCGAKKLAPMVADFVKDWFEEKL